ncbi:unnamed protein product, partial [Mesorhabditis spiculigera]
MVQETEEIAEKMPALRLDLEPSLSLSNSTTSLEHLPAEIHERILFYVGAFSPKNRFRYAKTCRRIWELTPTVHANMKLTRVTRTPLNFLSQETRRRAPIHDISSRTTQELLFSNATVERVFVGMPNFWLPGLKTKYLQLCGPMENVEELYEAMMPDGGYDSLIISNAQCCVGMEERIKATTNFLGITDEPNIMDCLRFNLPRMSFYSSTLQLAQLREYMQRVVEEWKAGRREVETIEIRFRPLEHEAADQRTQQHQRRDGVRLALFIGGIQAQIRGYVPPG